LERLAAMAIHINNALQIIDASYPFREQGQDTNKTQLAWSNKSQLQRYCVVQLKK
jgi:hypothetical protein